MDPSLQTKIVNHEYVDFTRLIPRDRLVGIDEPGQRLEIVNKGGLTYFAPVGDGKVTGILSFSRWEQAFRIYSNIYTRAYPEGASELIQYNHIIYTASQTFIWKNVYTYDKEFRTHMSQYPTIAGP